MKVDYLENMLPASDDSFPLLGSHTPLSLNNFLPIQLGVIPPQYLKNENSALGFVGLIWQPLDITR
jgi:hypothetical protein